jgi:hypothetical protein
MIACTHTTWSRGTIEIKSILWHAIRQKLFISILKIQPKEWNRFGLQDGMATRLCFNYLLRRNGSLPFYPFALSFYDTYESCYRTLPICSELQWHSWITLHNCHSFVTNLQMYQCPYQLIIHYKTNLNYEAF